MRIRITYGINGHRIYSDMYEAYLRVVDLKRDGIPVEHEVMIGTNLERNAWKDMFINDEDIRPD